MVGVQTCPLCEGLGVVLGLLAAEEECPACKGSGIERIRLTADQVAESQEAIEGQMAWDLP